jgi:hypothetical protein
MKITRKTTVALLASAFLLATTLPAGAQQAEGNGNGPKAQSGRNLGPGDGTGNQGVGPQDGTGYGSPYKGVPNLNGGTGAGPGICTGIGPKGTQGSVSRGTANRRGGRS